MPKVKFGFFKKRFGNVNRTKSYIFRCGFNEVIWILCGSSAANGRVDRYSALMMKTSLVVG